MSQTIQGNTWTLVTGAVPEMSVYLHEHANSWVSVGPDRHSLTFGADGPWSVALASGQVLMDCRTTTQVDWE